MVKQKIPPLLVLGTVLLCLFSCVGTNVSQDDTKKPIVAVDFPEKQLLLTDGIVAIPLSIRTAIPFRQTFSEKTQEKITEAVLEFQNTSARNLMLAPLFDGLQLVFADPEGKVEYVRPFESLLSSDSAGITVLAPSASCGVTLRYLYSETLEPVALAENGKTLLVFNMPEARLEQVSKALNKASALETCFYLARMLPYESVSTFMREQKIEINQTDSRGMTLLITGIIYNNLSVINGALGDGARINQPVPHGYTDVLPIHMAVLTNNRAAVNALLTAGASFDQIAPGGLTPGAVAVLDDNVAALKLLAAYGVDVENLEMPENLQNPQKVLTAIEYARKNNMQEITTFFERHLIEKKR